ncbi:hypothetical protein TCAL_16030 [Tigriopus californicus]|uniref:C-type lectin domain-containing protein n=1 Tax=Tigriopus californicus TaxID=6832 RepID=A0A553PQT1_TIGCA|nr:hypothetical protein TCAL_16030 [Tigriopus californicus]
MFAFKIALVACVTFIHVSTLPISERHAHPSPLTHYRGSHGGRSPYFRPLNRYPQAYSRHPYSPQIYSPHPYSHRPQRYRSKPVFDPYTRRFKITPSDSDRYDARERGRGRYRSRDDYRERNYYDDRGRQNTRGSGSSGFNQERRGRPNVEFKGGSGERRQDTREPDSSRFRTKYDRNNVDEDNVDFRQETRGFGSSGFRSKFDRDNLDQDVEETRGSESSGGAQNEYERNRQLFEQQRDSRRHQDQPQGFRTNDQTSNRNFGGQGQKRGTGRATLNQDTREVNQEGDQRNRFDYVVRHQTNARGSGSGSSGSSNFDQGSTRYQGGSSQRQSQRFDLPSSSSSSFNQNGNQRRDRESDSKTTFNLFGLDEPRQPREEGSNVKKFHYDKTQSLQMAQEAERKEQEAERRQQDFQFFNVFGDDPFQVQGSDVRDNDFNPQTTTYGPFQEVEPNSPVVTGSDPGRSQPAANNILGTPVSPFQPSVDDRESCPTEANWEINGKKFLITALEPRCPHMSWSDAVDFCRKSARMQAVSFQLEKRRQQIQAIMTLIMNPDTKMDAFWTAGVVSHPMSDRDPILVEWSTGKEEVRPGTKYWARTGLGGLAQPDNYYYRTSPEEGLDEACAAVHRDATGQPKLHDELCTQKYPVVCETSYAMPGDMMGGMLS